jgi:hypothetical protein
MPIGNADSAGIADRAGNVSASTGRLLDQTSKGPASLALSVFPTLLLTPLQTSKRTAMVMSGFTGRHYRCRIETAYY